ncbi:MAG: hypothetical protein JSW12_01320 [Deltaproteobacteria bacterium]|nr:MAG: hypothetical protein JSW12_01320 [Deltaproteobacteria bacterium]
MQSYKIPSYRLTLNLKEICHDRITRKDDERDEIAEFRPKHATLLCGRSIGSCQTLEAIAGYGDKEGMIEDHLLYLKEDKGNAPTSVGNAISGLRFFYAYVVCDEQRSPRCTFHTDPRKPPTV